MNKLYNYFQQHKILLLLIVLVTFGGAVYYGIQCKLEENIFKLLPPPAKDANVPDMVFSNIKLKDKVFVQVVAEDAEAVYEMHKREIEAERTEAYDEDMLGEDGMSEEELAEEKDFMVKETMAMAMDEFLKTAVEKDQQLGAIESTLGEVDPSMIELACQHLFQHGPAYLDITEEELDSLTSEDHIREQLAWYEQLMDTELGGMLAEYIYQDPCGISIFAASRIAGNDLTKIGMSEDENAHAIQQRIRALFTFGYIFTGDGEACIGFITPSFGTDDSKTAYKMIKNLDQAKAEIEAKYPGIKVLYHGTVILGGGNSQRIKKDIATTIGISVLLILLVLALTFKRPTYWGLLLAPITYSIFLALGLIFVARGWMSFMALGIGAIVIGVALSYCLHVMVHYVYIGDAGRTIAEQTKPVLMGSITTIGAFLGLLFTESSLLRDFGAFSSLVIVGTTLFSLIVMPHFFPKKNDANKRAFRFLEKVNSYDIDQNKWVCGIVLVWVVVCCLHANRYEFDANLRNINYVEPSVQESMDSWNKRMNGGMNQQYYASVAPTLNEALEKLPAMEAAADSLRRAGIVKNKIRISGMLPCASKQQQRIENWEAYFTEEKQMEIRERIAFVSQESDMWGEEDFEPFIEMMGKAEESHVIAASTDTTYTDKNTLYLPEKVLGNFAETVDGQVLVYFPIKTTVEDAKLAKDVLTQIEGCMVLDPYYYSTDLVELIHTDFIKIMMISSLFVLLLLLVTYKNLWIALIVFLPMTLSWYTVLGAMALFHQPFNMINTVVSAFVFGIGVDYSIFIMDGLLHGQKKTMASHKSAITLSATALITCMFSLIFAVHPSIHSIAFASLVGMITTIMLSYIIEPNLYKLYLKIKNRKN